MTTHANCLLLHAGGKHYYAEEFGKFIQITRREYDAIQSDPKLYHASTALLTHFEWCAAVGRGKTLTFRDALGQTQTGLSKLHAQTVSPQQPVKPTSKVHKATRKRVSVFTSVGAAVMTHCPVNRPTLILFLITAAVAIAWVHFDCGPVPDNSGDGSTAPQSPEIQRAIPIEPEVRKAIGFEPEIRKAFPVETFRQNAARPIGLAAPPKNSSAHHHRHIRFRADRRVVRDQ